ncbi:MAG: AraC family transcriptional regulator [Actinomycetota bacterium]
MATDLHDVLPALRALADPRRPVDLREVGELVGLSPGRAQRVMTALTGESPKRFDLRVRVDQAAVLLVTTDERVLDVAVACGFASHESLIRTFGARFGTTPTEWRRRARAAGWTEQLTRSNLVDHAAIAASASRCVGLYRRPLRSTPREAPAMPYEISTRTVEPVAVLFQTRRVEADALPTALAEVLPAVFGYAMEQGLPMAGPPVVRYLDLSPAFITFEGGVPLTAEAPAPAEASGIQIGWLHGGTVAVTQHRGPYEQLGDAHAALDRWIDANGAKSVGAPWESYITDPGDVPDPADWLTDVFWPVELPG